MDEDSSTTPARPANRLSRSRLARVLGLKKGTTVVRIDTALPRLLQHLEGRISHADPEEADRLRREIADLKASHASIRSKPGAIPRSPKNRHRAALLATAIGTLVVFALLFVYSAGVRTNRPNNDSATTSRLGTPGVLILEGALSGATLRVLDADREKVLIETAAEGARIELPEGRYAIEVSREDCADRWTRSIYFEEGSSHRFEPEICEGSAQLTAHSSAGQDSLRIDGPDTEGRTSDSDGAPKEAAPLPGRPIPVAKVLPLDAPSSTSSPIPFDAIAFRGPIEKPKLDFESVRLLPQPLPGEKPIGPGSTRWHDRVSATLVSRYDRDGSGRIDRLNESEAIPCSVWIAIERDFDEGRLGLTLVRYFGFDGSEWHPNALGFSRAHRSAAFAKMKECGLRT